MLLDSQLAFDPAGSAITVSRASTNVIDLLNAEDLGIGDNPTLKIAVFTDGLFAAAGAGTLQVQFQESVDNATWTTVVESPAYSLAQVNTQAVFKIDWPHRAPGAALPRYARLNYIVGTGPFTAGSVQSYVMIGRDDLPVYPKNYTAA